MIQSGIGATSETDVAALSSGQSLDFDDDTLKGKDIHYCYQLITKMSFDIARTNEIKTIDKNITVTGKDQINGCAILNGYHQLQQNLS